MNTPSFGHKWNSDRPGKYPDDDKLGRRKFAQRIAKELSSWREKDSLVVSLNGEWGAGKSTLKYLITHYIENDFETRSLPQPLVVEFNPWQWSAQGKLMAGFFDEIGAKLRTTGSGDLVNFWGKLQSITTAGTEIARKIQESLTATSAMLTAVAGVVTASIDDPMLSFSLGIVTVVLFVFTGLIGVFTPLAEAVAMGVTRFVVGRRQTMVETRAKLELELKKLKAPVIVIIDDIDRLTKREVRLIVQLVKANADLPNLVYLMLYQKSIVAGALGEFTGERGEDFLKKIVQVELEVPFAPDDKMSELFHHNLEHILKSAEIQWDKERWRQLYHNAVWPFFRTPRDIKRFHGALEFYFEGHVVDGVLEVNPIDLILLEVLRVFDPEAYETVSRAFQRQRNVFFEILYGDKEAKERFELGIKKLVDREELGLGEQKRLRSLLYGLFPQAVESGSSENDSEWKRDLRICHPAHFPRYFQLGSEPGIVPASVVSKLIKSEGGAQAKLTYFKDAIYDGYFNELLERLRSVSDDIPESEVAPLSMSLLDLSDELPTAPPGSLLSADPDREVGQLVAHLMTRIPERNARFKILSDSIAATDAITGPLMLVSYLDYDADQNPDSMEGIVDSESRHQLKKELLHRMWETVRSGKVWKIRRSAFLLFSIRRWDGNDDILKFIRTAVADPKVAISFLEAMLNKSQESGSGASQIVYYLRPKEIMKWVDLDELISAAEIAVTTDLHRAAVTAGRRVLRLQEKNYPDEVYVMSIEG